MKFGPARMHELLRFLAQRNRQDVPDSFRHVMTGSGPIRSQREMCCKVHGRRRMRLYNTATFLQPAIPLMEKVFHLDAPEGSSLQ